MVCMEIMMTYRLERYHRQIKQTLGRDLVKCKHKYLHTVGRQRQEQHKQMDLEFVGTITYRLWKGKGRNSMNKYICNLQA
jgi:hypothetical protein